LTNRVGVQKIPQKGWGLEKRVRGKNPQKNGVEIGQNGWGLAKKVGGGQIRQKVGGLAKIDLG